ncbi:MAG: PIN domain-containing protein [Synergistaceae bacterium]|jgi:predicted nucleic acid-binding protein|nr:PIN domain-containing protein [Synergistaceae bacterium]
MMPVNQQYLKIYLDTSVISYLDQRDAPERMAETHKLWEKIKCGEFKVVISDIGLLEIAKCEKTKRNTLLGYLNEIDYTVIEVQGNERAAEIAGRFIGLGVLKQKNFDDCQHIAAAIISGCDAIVSWNFKHMVNPRTAKGIRAITTLEGCKDILIFDPLSFIGGETE